MTTLSTHFRSFCNERCRTGSGKTSLLRLLAQQDWPDEGTIEVRRGAIISYLPQSLDLDQQLTALDAITQSDSPVATAVRKYNRLLGQGEKAARAVCSIHLLLAFIVPVY
jgi:ATPase subunit of ABC transporter with duplicated ATPase domains